MKTKVDYETLEREYTTQDISIRDLAKKHDMAWSTVADQARKRGWTTKREAFKAKVTEKALEKDARRYVNDMDDMQFEQIQAARAIIFSGLEAIRDGKVIVQPRDITLAIDKLQLLVGRPTDRTEATVVGNVIPAGAGMDPELLRRLEELSRGARDDTPSAPRLRIEGSKPN